jgi:hypothetical protein
MTSPNLAVGAGLVSARFGESPTVFWVPTRGTPTNEYCLCVLPYGLNFFAMSQDSIGGDQISLFNNGCGRNDSIGRVFVERGEQC